MSSEKTITLTIDHLSPAIQTGSLVKALRDNYFHEIAAQIEEQVRPRPAEPQGLGAVVEDRSGVRWIRLHTHGACNDWYLVKANDYTREDVSHGGRRKWHQIDAVLVLSEGVKA